MSFSIETSYLGKNYILLSAKESKHYDVFKLIEIKK